jgi:hypothetical protein
MPINPQADGVETSGLRQRVLNKPQQTVCQTAFFIQWLVITAPAPLGRKFPLYFGSACAGF